MKRLTLGDLKRNIPKDKKNRKFDRSGYVYTEKYLSIRKDISEGKVQDVYDKLKTMGLGSDQLILESKSGREEIICFE